MITITKQPPIIDLSGNYMPLWLESDDTIEQAGQPCTGSITFTSIPAVDDVLVFQFTKLDTSLSFVFKDTPDDSGLQVPRTGSSVTNWILNSLIPALQSNYLMDQAFEYTRNGDDLEFTTRENTDQYNLTIDTGGMTGATATVVSGVLQKRWPNFRMRVLLEVQDLEEALIAQRELELSPAEDTVFFELSKVLRRLHSRLVPSLADSDWQDLSATVLRYRYRYAEVRDTPAQVRKITNGTWRYALPGGKSIEGLINLSDFTSRYLPGGGISRFLSLSEERTILEDQDFLISWMSPAPSITSINSRVTFYYTDGSNSAATVIDNLSGVKYPGIYCFNAGFSAIESLADSEKTVDYYEIRVNESLSARSTVYTLRLSREPKMDLLQVVYRNALGAYEVWAFKGQVNYSVRLERENGRVTLIYPEASTERDRASIYEELEEAIVARTGYLTKTEIDLFSEVLLSPDVYLKEGDKLWPVLLEAGEVATKDTYSYDSNFAEVVITRQPKEFYYA